MSLIACLVLYASGARSGAEEPFRPALRRGEMRLALEQARAQEDPVLVARGEVEVLYFAGDLRGALERAERGLALHPADAWLGWRACEIAKNLGLARVARDGLIRFLAADFPRVAGSDQLQDAGFWEQQRASLAAEIAALESRDELAARALQRARWVTVLVLAGGIVALVCFARPPRTR